MGQAVATPQNLGEKVEWLSHLCWATAPSPNRISRYKLGAREFVGLERRQSRTGDNGKVTQRLRQVVVFYLAPPSGLGKWGVSGAERKGLQPGHLVATAVHFVEADEQKAIVFDGKSAIGDPVEMSLPLPIVRRKPLLGRIVGDCLAPLGLASLRG